MGERTAWVATFAGNPVMGWHGDKAGTIRTVMARSLEEAVDIVRQMPDLPRGHAAGAVRCSSWASARDMVERDVLESRETRDKMAGWADDYVALMAEITGDLVWTVEAFYLLLLDETEEAHERVLMEMAERIIDTLHLIAQQIRLKKRGRA